MTIADATKAADVIMMLAPDTEQKAIYDAHIAPNLSEPVMRLPSPTVSTFASVAFTPLRAST